MQCHEVRPSGLPFLGSMNESTPIKTEKEAIHSGHFMVSHFEAEAQDDEYEVAVPVPETRYPDENSANTPELQVFNVNKPCQAKPPGQLAIETSLTKLFQCMSLAYRQKLTSPKWNRFKGIRLRWKDKIRLNNVIWRCWHMQFIKKENTLICQFASPLDEGTHNKPEAVVLEGKYWKRRLAAVTAEYKKWRMFYRNKIMDWTCKESTVSELDMFDWPTHNTEMQQLGPMMVDEDYMDLMSDTLFSTITSNQPFAFPDTREIARGANLADFIQPSLVQLQPNLDDFVDSFEPLQDLFTSKLPLAPEECAVTDVAYRPAQTFADLDVQNQASVVEQPPQQQQPEALTYRSPAEPSNVYQQVINYTESVPPADPMKTTRFYEDKVKPEEMVCFPRVPGLTITAEDPNQFLSAEQNARNKVTVINDTFSFEGDNSRQRSSLRNIQQQQQQQQPPPPQQQQPFKFPSAAPKANKFHQYQKFPSSYCAPGYDGNQINYDLAVPSEPALIKPPINPEQNITNVKNRRRSRDGAPKTPIRPPPLTTTNSDSALNLPSALLAQLLTNNTTVHNIQNATDRFYAAQPLKKSSRAPILPMPSKPSQQNKILLKPKKSAMHSTTIPSQNMRNVLRPISSPDSPKDSSCVQNVPSPGTLSQSPTSPLMFPGSLSPSKINKYDGTKTGSGNVRHSS
ncbi:UNVERIFIED_CONTAM: hypothetical protein PYX00_005204 [Menopon gallinae]|uniref:MLX-interacting protein n=1 Tax=Menopon gallinae TaxID=328185 RepID=A0AAW2HQF5_9NEOP